MPGNRILRYRFENNLGPRELQLPLGAKVVAAAHYNGAPALWVSVADTEPGEAPSLEIRRFLLTTTGQRIEEELGPLVGISIATGHEILIFEIDSPEIELEERIEAVGANVDTMIGAYRDRLEAIESPTGLSIPDLERRVDGSDEARVQLGDEVEDLRRRVDGDERKLSALGRDLELEKNRLEDRILDVERGLEGRVSELERIESSR